MDLFEIPDDYKPQKPLTDAEVDDITNYLKGHPLFLKELPEDITGNQHLVALQSMKAEETPEVRAQQLNKQANARLKQGPNSPYYMKDAYSKYSEAIDLKPNDPILLAKIRGNRAMVNLRYKNYGKVIEDCQKSISLDPNYIKAYYRLGKAFIHLGKYHECVELLTDSNDPDLKVMLKEAKQLKIQDQNKIQKMEEKQVVSLNRIEEYFKQKKWRLGKRSEQLPEGVEIQFIEDKISIPLVVVYPEFSQFDLIAKTGQHQKISESLKELFSSPLPWDTKGQYNIKSIQLFAEVEQAVLIKLPKQATINEIAMRAPVRGALQIIILIDNNFGDYYKKQYKIY